MPAGQFPWHSFWPRKFGLCKRAPYAWKNVWGLCWYNLSKGVWGIHSGAGRFFTQSQFTNLFPRCWMLGCLCQTAGGWTDEAHSRFRLTCMMGELMKQTFLPQIASKWLVLTWGTFPKRLLKTVVKSVFPRNTDISGFPYFNSQYIAPSRLHTGQSKQESLGQKSQCCWCLCARWRGHWRSGLMTLEILALHHITTSSFLKRSSKLECSWNVSFWAQKLFEDQATDLSMPDESWLISCWGGTAFQI